MRLAAERCQLGSERSNPNSSVVLLGLEPNEACLLLGDGVEELLTSRRLHRKRRGLGQRQVMVSSGRLRSGVFSVERSRMARIAKNMGIGEGRASDCPWTRSTEMKPYLL